MLTKKQKQIIKNYNININNENKKEDYELEFYSNCGEDFVFYIDDATDFINYANNFDPDEHASMWFGANRGEPSSLQYLLDDANEIKELLTNVANELKGCL